MDRSIYIILYQTLTQKNSILVVITFPCHEADQRVLSKCQLTIGCRWSISDHLTLCYFLSLEHDWSLVIAVGLVASCKLCQNIFSAVSVLLTYYDTIGLRTLHDTCFFCKYTDTGIDRCLCLHTGSYYRCLGGKKRHCLTLHVRSHQCPVCIIVLQERNQCCSNGEHHLWRYVHVIECSLIVLLCFFTVTTGYGITNKMSILIQFLVRLRYMVIIFLIRSHVYNFVCNTRIVFI